MKKNANPVVMILDGNSRLTLQLAAEVARGLGATVIGVGPEADCHLLRSRYCDVKDISPWQNDSGYDEALLRLILKHRPDAVLSANHRSVAALDAIRDRAPEGVGLCIPRSDALEASLDKSKTLAAAKRIGLGVPEDYTDAIKALDSSGRRDVGELEKLMAFPVFIKAAREAHSHIAAKIYSPSRFWPIYDNLRRLSEDSVEDGTILVQEYVNSDGRNYCYSFLFIEDTVELSFGHQKIRAVPREIGSASRARVFHDNRLREMSERLLRELEWGNGVALVEYKKRSDGTYVLMEINSRFWGAYALAKKSGCHFASTMVAKNSGARIKNPPSSVRLEGEMWFPFREVKFLVDERGEAPLAELARSIFAAWWPPCRWDINLRDYSAWLHPGGLRGFLSRRLKTLRSAGKTPGSGS